MGSVRLACVESHPRNASASNDAALVVQHSREPSVVKWAFVAAFALHGQEMNGENYEQEYK